MSRLFGWSLPPGAANHPLAPWNQSGPYVCEVCLCDSEVDCRCVECPTCGEYGNPRCYEPGGHGLVLDREVAIGRRGREFLMFVADLQCWQADELYAREFEEDRDAIDYPGEKENPALYDEHPDRMSAIADYNEGKIKGDA